MSTVTTTRTGRIPIGHTLTSLIGLGPIPLTKVIATHAMVTEANHPAPQPPAASSSPDFSNTEDTVRTGAEKKAQRGLDATVSRVIEPLIAQIKHKHAEINTLDAMLDNLTQAPLVGIHGETYTRAEADHTHAMGREALRAAEADGSHAHHTQPSHKLRDLAMLGLDYPVFLYAMMSLLNVDVRTLTTAKTLIGLGIAATFALLGTLLLGLTMRRMGRRHRAYKGHAGTIDAPAPARRTIRVEIIVTIAIAVAAAAVMATRVVTEGLSADGNRVLAIVLGVFFAFLVLASCYINYRSEYDNGSQLTDEVNHLSTQLRGMDHLAATNRLSRQVCVEQAGTATAQLNRAITKARSTATRAVTTSSADKAIHLARSYHHAPNATLTAPRLDYARLDKAAEQALQLTAHQKHLERTGQPALPLTDDELYDLLTTKEN